MKTLPVFWPNLFSRLVFSLLILLLLTKGEIRAQNLERPPGIIEGLQIFIENQREQYVERVQNMRSQIGIEFPITEKLLKDAYLDPVFLKNIFLHTETRWVQYLGKNECAFIALLQNDLLKNGLKNITTIPLLIGKEKRPHLISKKKYLEQTLKYKCFSLKQIQFLFSKPSLSKTLEGLNFPVPKTLKSCQSILSDWKDNSYLPFLCKIPEIMRKGRSAELILTRLKKPNLRLSRQYSPLLKSYRWYKENISFSKRSYLKNLCLGLNNSKKFCAPYLADDVWTKIINGEQPQEKMYYKCRNLYQKQSITLNQLKTCSLRMNQSPEICTSKTAIGFSSLYPRPDCLDISNALNKSHLKTNYHDCPGAIDNTSLTNIHRVINHISPKSKKYGLLSSPENCASETNYTFAKLNIDFKSEKAWPLKICYLDKIEDKEICKPYVPGKVESAEGKKLSEEYVVSNILKRIRGMEDYKKCKVTPFRKYNPSLLEYKNGCFIIYKENQCGSAHCKRKIILDEKEITSLKYLGKVNFSYFPNSFTKSKFSAQNIISDIYKVDQKRINNLTELEVFLVKYNYSILHGIGCAQNILPHHFRSFSLNSCTPLPFIVDGVISKKKSKFLSVRTALDDLHSPRLIPWNFIFSALANYRKLHPLRSWVLYGIKKKNK